MSQASRAAPGAVSYSDPLTNLCAAFRMAAGRVSFTATAFMSVGFRREIIDMAMPMGVRGFLTRLATTLYLFVHSLWVPIVRNN